MNMKNQHKFSAARRLTASWIAGMASASALAFSATAFAQVTPLGPAGPPLSAALQAKMAEDFPRLQEVEARAARVDDVNGLRNLQGIFGYYFDKAMWDDVSDLFADDGTIELGLNGVYAGKANIRK